MWYQKQVLPGNTLVLHRLIVVTPLTSAGGLQNTSSTDVAFTPISSAYQKGLF